MTENDTIQREADAMTDRFYDIITAQPFDEVAMTSALVALGQTAIMVMAHMDGRKDNHVRMFTEMVELLGKKSRRGMR